MRNSRSSSAAPDETAQSLQFVPVQENKAADVPEEGDLKRDEYWLSSEEAKERVENGKNVGPILQDQLSVLILVDPKKLRPCGGTSPNLAGQHAKRGDTPLLPSGGRN